MMGKIAKTPPGVVTLVGSGVLTSTTMKASALGDWYVPLVLEHCARAAAAERRKTRDESMVTDYWLDFSFCFRYNNCHLLVGKTGIYMSEMTPEI